MHLLFLDSQISAIFQVAPCHRSLPNCQCPAALISQAPLWNCSNKALELQMPLAFGRHMCNIWFPSASLSCCPWILPLPLSWSGPCISCFGQNAPVVTENPLLICWTSLREQTSLSCGKRSFTYANQVNESRTVKGFIPEAFAYLALEIFECSAPSCATRTQKPWQYVFSGDYIRRQLPSWFATATIWGIGSFEHRG